jgi:tetratricopeptide (TPR) repeat protein
MVMPAPVRFFFATVLIALCAGFAPCLQADGQQTQGESFKEHYDLAEHLLKENELNQAADQFRAFLSEAIGELAIERAHEGDYAEAERLFDEALALAPDAPQLRLQFAGASLLNGDFPEARSLSLTFLKDFPGEPAASRGEGHQILGRALLKMNQDKNARNELEQAVALDPSFQNSYDLAVSCLDVNDEQCAAQTFAGIEKRFGDTPAIHMTFGRAYGNSDFAPHAVVEFKQALAEDPHLHGAHYCLAAALLATGGDEATVQAAEAQLKLELANSPNDFLTYAALGKISATQLRYAAAEGYLRRAIALNPKNPDAYLYLGQMDYDMRNFDGAEPFLRQAIKLTTDPSRNRYQIQKAYYLLGRILMQQHHEEEAHAQMQEARLLANKVLSNDKSELAGMLAGASAAADSASLTPDAAAADSSAMAQNPTGNGEFRVLEKQLAPAIADSYNNLGAIKASSADYAGALRDFKRAMAWNPELDGIDYNLGHAAFMASQFSEAVAPLSRYLAARPDNSGIRDALGISQFMTHDYKGCVATLRRIQDQPGAIPQVQFVYADSLAKTGEVAAGVRRLQTLEKAHPEIPDVHRGLGEAFAGEGETQNAFRELRIAAQLNPRDTQTHDDLATLELKTGNTEAAIGELQAAIDLQPSEPSFHRELAHAYNLAFRLADAEKELDLYKKLEAAQVNSQPPAEMNDP